MLKKQKIIENVDTFQKIELTNSQKRDEWIGYKVITTKQIITLEIQNDGQCCEDWGIECWTKDEMSHTTLSDMFLNSHIKSVMWSNHLLNDKYKERIEDGCEYDKSFHFAAVNIATDRADRESSLITSELKKNALSVDCVILLILQFLPPDMGVIQLVVFNEHNGFYPHAIRASWQNYSDDTQTL